MVMMGNQEKLDLCAFTMAIRRAYNKYGAFSTEVENLGLQAMARDGDAVEWRIGVARLAIQAEDACGHIADAPKMIDIAMSNAEKIYLGN